MNLGQLLAAATTSGVLATTGVAVGINAAAAAPHAAPAPSATTSVVVVSAAAERTLTPHAPLAVAPAPKPQVAKPAHKPTAAPRPVVAPVATRTAPAHHVPHVAAKPKPAPDQPLTVVEHTLTVTADGEVVVLGQAVNNTETTFDHAVVRVGLFDAAGTQLNAPLPGELEQVAGDTIRPGDTVPFGWSQALPDGYDHATVTVVGVDATSAGPPIPLHVQVVDRRDAAGGAQTLVVGRVGADETFAVGVSAEVAAYDPGGHLIAFGSADFGGDPLIVLDPSAGWVRFTARLDVPLENVATVRVFASASAA